MSPGPAHKPGYDILILPDGEAARRFRLTKSRLAFYKYCLAFLLLLAATGLSATWFLTNESLRTAELLQQTQKDLISTKAQIERIGNIDELLRGEDPENIAEKLRALDEMTKRQLAQQQQQQQPQAADEDDADDSQDCPKIDLAELFGTQNNGADVGNIKIRFEAGKGFLVTFDVTNAEPKNPIAGAVTAFVLLKDASVVPLSATKEELNFSINRLKSFNTTLTLPPEIGRAQCFALILEITTQAGKKLYHGLTILPRE